MEPRLLNLHDQILTRLHAALESGTEPSCIIVSVKPFPEDVKLMQEDITAVANRFAALINEFATVVRFDLCLPGWAAPGKVGCSVPELAVEVHIRWTGEFVEKARRRIQNQYRVFNVQVQVKLAERGSAWLIQAAKDGELDRAAVGVVDHYLRAGALNHGLTAEETSYINLFKHAKVSLLPATVVEVPRG